MRKAVRVESNRKAMRLEGAAGILRLLTLAVSEHGRNHRHTREKSQTHTGVSRHTWEKSQTHTQKITDTHMRKRADTQERAQTHMGEITHTHTHTHRREHRQDTHTQQTK